MENSKKDILTSTLDQIYTGIQGLEMPMKPENVRIMSNVFDDLKAMYDLIVAETENPEGVKKDDV